MLTPDSLFQICGLLATLGWLCLVSTPLWPRSVLEPGRESLPRLIGAIAIPALIALIYSSVILTHWAGHPGSFNSLDGVMLLFTSRWLVVAGWVHYLAFDLFIGGWELADSRSRRIPHLAMVPILALTFFFGPMGFLAYLAIRAFFKQNKQQVVS